MRRDRLQPSNTCSRLARTGLILTLALIAVLPVARPMDAYAQAPDEARVLELGKPIDREMAGDAVHLYRVMLQSGQYMRVLVNQRGIDVVLSLLGPDRKKITESNSDNGNFGLEPASLIASAPGEYVVEVRSPEKKAPPGKYDIRLEQLRVSNPLDKDRVAAEKLFLEGDHLRAPGKADGIRQAMVKYQEALALLQRAADPLIEGQVLHGLGRLHTVLGDKPKALEYYLKALPARRASGDRRGEATTLNSLGATYISLGELQKAVDYFKQALPIRREVGDRRGEAVTVNNIGVIYHDLGQVERSIEYFLKSLTMRRELGDRESEATTLQNLAKNYNELGNRQEAATYYKQALDILDSLEQRRNAYTTLEWKGDYYELIGDKDKAIDYYKKSLSLAKAMPDIFTEHWLERKIGSIAELAGDPDNAFVHYSRALELVRLMDSKTGESNVLTLIARVERDRGHFENALKAAQAAIDRAESIRSNIEVVDLRASYFATAQRLYGFTIDLLMQMNKRQPSAGYDAAALQVSEKARARILIDSLAEAKANIREGADRTLLEQQRTIEQQLNDQAAKLRRLLLTKHTDEQVNDVKKEIETLRSAYEETLTRIRITSPRYAALVYPQPLSLSGIQRQVLDDNTLLLEYSLGQQRSYLWAVTPSTLSGYELPSRAEIESGAKRVYEALTARNKTVKFETPEERHGRIIKADAEFFEASQALGKMLLGPVAPQLKQKRLLIVTDGALQYIPFATLSVPARNEQTKQPTSAGSLLVNEHEIVSLPSASTLAVIRNELSDRTPAPKTLAVLADPVFDATDPRLSVAGKSAKGNGRQHRDRPPSQPITATESDVNRAMTETDSEGEVPQYIPRLPFTRREANAITSLVPVAAREEALDFTANRATALSPELGQYRFVHFATHGFLNSKHPELSGIVLSLVDAQGREQEGFLRAHEIYNLKLPADLVVLSGCRTGLGKEIRGEGLVSLTRGFMYAGAARVLVSLWDVNDEATAELMARFYKLMLGRKRLAPAAALREAQTSMSREKRWQAPYYWAGFVLQGEPK